MTEMSAEEGTNKSMLRQMNGLMVTEKSVTAEKPIPQSSSHNKQPTRVDQSLAQLKTLRRKLSSTKELKSKMTNSLRKRATTGKLFAMLDKSDRTKSERTMHTNDLKSTTAESETVAGMNSVGEDEEESLHFSQIMNSSLASGLVAKGHGESKWMEVKFGEKIQQHKGGEQQSSGGDSGEEPVQSYNKPIEEISSPTTRRHRKSSIKERISRQTSQLQPSCSNSPGIRRRSPRRRSTIGRKGGVDPISRDEHKYASPQKRRSSGSRERGQRTASRSHSRERTRRSKSREGNNRRTTRHSSTPRRGIRRSALEVKSALEAFTEGASVCEEPPEICDPIQSRRPASSSPHSTRSHHRSSLRNSSSRKRSNKANSSSAPTTPTSRRSSINSRTYTPAETSTGGRRQSLGYQSATPTGGRRQSINPETYDTSKTTTDAPTSTERRTRRHSLSKQLSNLPGMGDEDPKKSPSSVVSYGRTPSRQRTRKSATPSSGASVASATESSKWASSKKKRSTTTTTSTDLIKSLEDLRPPMLSPTTSRPSRKVLPGAVVVHDASQNTTSLVQQALVLSSKEASDDKEVQSPPPPQVSSFSEVKPLKTSTHRSSMFSRSTSLKRPVAGKRESEALSRSSLVSNSLRQNDYELPFHISSPTLNHACKSGVSRLEFAYESQQRRALVADSMLQQTVWNKPKQVVAKRA